MRQTIQRLLTISTLPATNVVIEQPASKKALRQEKNITSGEVDGTSLITSERETGR